MSSNSEEHEKEDAQQSEPAEQQSSSSRSPEPDTRAEQSQETTSPESVTAPPQWQAIWSPQYNAYYFYNHVTQETTWTNPLQPEEGSSSSVSVDQTPPTDEGHTDENAATSSTGLTYSSALSKYAALQAAAVAQGIDPGLAHLDPSLGASLQGTSNVPGDVPTFTAQFNAHTGRFTAPSSRTPGHLSEYERMKRMSEFYFDVSKWEEDLAAQQEDEGGSGKKRKRPTKKDLERFKEQKRLKKIAKTAWLRT